MPRPTTIWCCACERDVTGQPATGADVYPHRPDLVNKKFFLCPTCKNYVGCHAGGKPLGNIPTPALRRARGEIHAILDPIWKRGRMKRGSVYQAIGDRIGYQYHTAEIRTIEDARAIYRVVQHIAREHR